MAKFSNFEAASAKKIGSETAHLLPHVSIGPKGSRRSAEKVLQSLRPPTYQRVMDVLVQAQIDVSRWADYKGANPASNPQVYQWSFEQPGERVALFIWWSGIRIKDGRLTYAVTPRKPTGLSPASEAKWKASSERYLRHVQTAYEQELPIAAVIVDGKQFDAKTNPRASIVERRMLDDAAWAVSEFDFDARRAIIVRGMAPVHPHSGSIDLELTAFEGWKRRAFIWHRHREAILRRAKIAQVKEAKSGRLTCQVPRCNFDFGKDMAHWVKATPTFTTLYR